MLTVENKILAFPSVCLSLYILGVCFNQAFVQVGSGHTQC